MHYKPEILGKNLKTERKRIKLTQEQLGEKLNMSGKQISNYEHAKQTPPLEILFQFCELFNCELGYLLGEENYSQKTKVQTIITNELNLSIKACEAIKRYTKGASITYPDFLSTYSLKDSEIMHAQKLINDYQEISTEVINSLICSDIFFILISKFIEIKNLVHDNSAKYIDLADPFDIIEYTSLRLKDELEIKALKFELQELTLRLLEEVIH